MCWFPGVHQRALGSGPPGKAIHMNRAVLIAWAAGAVFAPLGGLCAGIITYAEYSRHRLAAGRAIREATGSALPATAILLAVAGLIGVGVDATTPKPAMAGLCRSGHARWRCCRVRRAGERERLPDNRRVHRKNADGETMS